MIQRVSDPFDDLVMDSNKSLKSIYKGSRRNGVRMAKRKKGMTFIPYDYEAAYNKSLEDMHEFFVEQMLKWYPDFDFTDAGIYYNDFNSMFYIRARMRKRRQQ